MIRILDDLEALSRAAVLLFVEKAAQAIRERGRFCVALSGGSTPRRTYELLGELPYSRQVDWSRVQLFWGDERCVAPDDPRSNERLARAAFLDKIPLAEAQIHPLRCGTDPQGAARYHEERLRTFFPGETAFFDVVLLGLGKDGHTASLIPGADVPPETGRLVLPVQVRGEEFARLTLTGAALDAARLVVFLVAGREKADILHEVLEGQEGRYPAQRIASGAKDVLWLIDRAAAGLVEEEDA